MQNVSLHGHGQGHGQSTSGFMHQSVMASDNASSHAVNNAVNSAVNSGIGNAAGVDSAVTNAVDVMRQLAQLPAVHTPLHTTAPQTTPQQHHHQGAQLATPHTNTPQEAVVNKPSRLRLILRMKELTRQLHDYSLLVKDSSNLQLLVNDLENVVGQASTFVAVEPQKPMKMMKAKRCKTPEMFTKP